MRIARGRAGVPSERRDVTFSGEVWGDPVLAPEDGIYVNNVFFAPGGRTDWHTHEIAQVLYVIAGSGWVQVRDGEGMSITAGDTVHIPADEEHWHGATADAYLLHLAVSVGTTNWLDRVTDADYAAALGSPVETSE